MYLLKDHTLQENTKKTKMLILFNSLSEEDKDIVISMSDSLVMRITNFEQEYEQHYTKSNG